MRTGFTVFRRARYGLCTWACAVLVGCASSPTPAVSSAPAPALSIADPAALDRVLDQRVGATGYPFLYARLEDAEGRVLYEHSVIDEALLPGRRIDGDTWFRIWSMSKLVTIATVMDLVEEGIIDLDDPVTEYIPEFADLKVAVAPDGQALPALDDASEACPVSLTAVESPMTVDHLIHHKAGFYYGFSEFDCLNEALWAVNLPLATSSDELIARFAKLPLVVQPGTKPHYGTNTTILGLVAERATGNTLKELVASRLTGPLQIDGLQYGKPPGVALVPTASGADGTLRFTRAGELDIFGDHLPGYEADYPLYLGGEGMLATADGYADFLRMLMEGGALNGGRLLDQATVAKMTSPHTYVDSEYGYNGYNVWVSSGLRSDGTYGRAGLWYVGGYEGTLAWADPKYGLVGVVMTQAFAVPEGGKGRDEAFVRAVYEQLRGIPGQAAGQTD